MNSEIFNEIKTSDASFKEGISSNDPKIFAWNTVKRDEEVSRILKKYKLTLNQYLSYKEKVEGNVWQKTV